MLRAHASVSEHHVFLRGQTFETHWPACMQFVGGDADLGTQSIFKSVGKLGARIHHHAGGIHFAQKALGIAPVLGHDGVGVMRAVLFDVANGFI